MPFRAGEIDTRCFTNNKTKLKWKVLTKVIKMPSKGLRFDRQRV